jgi:predicted dehydrogenase
MSRPRLRTAVVGFGKVAAGYADDPVMAHYYPFATHAQVLAVHPVFAWEAVVDVSEEALALAQQRWRILHVAKSVQELARQYEPEIAVIATPPQFRSAIIEQLPSLRASLVEKPLGLTLEEGQAFLEECLRRGILVQVNLWRRADEGFQALCGGRLDQLIGRPQLAFGVYGNGLLNNGTHMVDFVRMLLGEVETVQAVSGIEPYPAGPIPDDVHVPFTLRLRGGLVVMIQPIRFEHYRENGLDIWGEKGRLLIAQEGLGLFLYPRCENRAMQGEREIASDQPQLIESTVGRAFYRMYDNLAAAVYAGEPLWSPGGSALQTTRVVEAVMQSVERNGELVELD